MADISKVTTLDGTTYDIKDAIARAELQTKMPMVTYGTPSVIVDTTTVSFSKDGDNDWYISEANPISGMTFAEDTLYKVEWDGTEYDAYYIKGYLKSPSNNGGYDYCAVGNLAIFGHDNLFNTEASFVITKHFKSTETTTIRVLTSSTDAQHSIKITAVPFTKEVPDEQTYQEISLTRPASHVGSGNASAILNFGGVASGEGSVAFNLGSKATGVGSAAFGVASEASGQMSIAENYCTVASGAGSHAEGSQSVASGAYAHAEGYQTTSSGYGTHSEGARGTASGNWAHSEGDRNIASGAMSHAEGLRTIANHASQHVFGECNVADTSSAAATARGNYVEIVGNGTADDARSNARTLDWSGNETLAGKITATGFVHAPIATKIYTDVIATSNDNVGGGFFYLKVRSTAYTTKWHVKTRVTATVPSNINYYTQTTFDIYGFSNTYSWYSCLNDIRSTSYRPIYYNSVFFTNETGYNNDCGHWIGFNLWYATNNTSTSYKRSITVELLEYDGCTVELQDSLITPTDIPNRADHTGWYSSSDTSFTNLDACNYGLKQSGDANTTSISNLIRNNGSFVADSALYRYQLLFQKDENTLTPLNNVSNDVGTSKSMLTNVEFNPFGFVHYYGTTTTVNANGAVGSLFYAYNGVDLRYTFNCGTTLTAHKPFYLKLIPQSNGTCKIAGSSPWAQTLPTTADTYWYMYLGRTYSTYQFVLYPDHPVYYHDGSSVKQVFPTDMINATTSMPGLMSAADKTTLNTLASSSYWQYNSSTDSIDLIFPS